MTTWFARPARSDGAEQLSTDAAITKAHLEAALDLLEDCASSYRDAPAHIKKIMNQAQERPSTQSNSSTRTGPRPRRPSPTRGPTGVDMRRAPRNREALRPGTLGRTEPRQHCSCHRFSSGHHGGAKGIRTPDLLIANETRYQLRYSPLRSPRVAQRPRRTGTRKGCQGPLRRAR